MAIFKESQIPKQLGGDEGWRKLQAYLFQNNELLRYMFGNLDPEENYSDDALKKYIERGNKIATLEFDVSGLTISLQDLSKETKAQLKVTSEQITTEISRATKAEGELGSKITQTALEIRSEVSDTEKNLQSQITQSAEKISLKVSKGEVSSQISLETGTVTLSGNRLVVNSKNFKLDSSGNATFSGNVTGATISGGSIEIGDVFYADEDGALLGDYEVSTDNTGRFKSSDGNIMFETAATPSGVQFKFGKLTYTGGDLTNAGDVITGGFLEGYDVILEKSWWMGIGITERIQFLSDCLWELASIIDEQWNDYDGVYDALDNYYEDNKPW